MPAAAGVRPVSAASLMHPARVQSRDMEKLRRREEKEALATWQHVVDYCADNQVNNNPTCNQCCGSGSGILGCEFWNVYVGLYAV